MYILIENEQKCQYDASLYYIISYLLQEAALDLFAADRDERGYSTMSVAPSSHDAKAVRRHYFDQVQALQASFQKEQCEKAKMVWIISH
jgi:hypothetical protein